MRIRDMTFGAFLLVVCIWLLIHTGEFFVPINPVAPPALWPQIILSLLACLSALLIIVNFYAYRKEAKQAREAGIAAPKLDIRGFIYEKRKVLGSIGITLAFLFAFVPVGFILSSIAYFVAVTCILEPSKDYKVLAIRVVQAVVLVAVVYVVFMIGLNVQLPPGILPADWFM